MALSLNLADALSFVGLAGTALAIACALIAAIAFTIIGAPAGGSVASGGWLVSVLLSLCAGFAGAWLLPAIALAALPLSLILMGAVGLLRATLARPSSGALHGKIRASRMSSHA